MGLGGLLGDDQGVADLGVGQAVSDQPQHLGFAGGKRAESRRETPARGVAGGRSR